MQRGLSIQTVTFPWQDKLSDGERLRVRLRPMSHATRQAQQDNAIEERTTRKGTRRIYRVAQLETDALVDHITFVDTVKGDLITDEKGDKRPWPDSTHDRTEFLSLLEPRETAWLVNIIRRQAELNEDEAGESGSPSGATPGGESTTAPQKPGDTAAA